MLFAYTYAIGMVRRISPPILSRSFDEEKKTEHGRPERQFVVRGDHLWRIEVGFEGEELRWVDGRHNDEPRA